MRASNGRNLAHGYPSMDLVGGENGGRSFPRPDELAEAVGLDRIRLKTKVWERSSSTRSPAVPPPGSTGAVRDPGETMKNIGEISIDGLIGFVPHLIHPEEGATPYRR